MTIIIIDKCTNYFHNESISQLVYETTQNW